ncbi:MAG: AAA family ATPase [Propionibacteriaceae bacterium]|nr:AAA family ATPase [Propionibacteriaceae bacterium]
MVPPPSRSALTQQLAAARKRMQLSIRRVAAIAKVPASTAQGWLDGRHLPTPALMPQFMTLLRALQLATVHDEEEWAQAIEQMRRSSVVAEAPYVGLRPYDVSETNLFVGRERTLEELYGACSAASAPRLVFLVGPTGVGKSSLLAAGLIGRGTAPDGPLADLPPVRLAVRELANWNAPTGKTLLVIDQFEELRYLTAREANQAVRVLCNLPDEVTCVLGLNANAVGEILSHDELAPYLAAPILIGPLTTAEYRSIIETPARLHGRSVTPDLVQVALRDLHQYGYPDPGTVLPLLSSALRRTWERANGDTLTTSDYLTSGGLWNSLNDEAEAVWVNLPESQRLLTRRLLLSLVVIDQDQLLRRSIPYSSLEPDTAIVAETLIRSRLLSRNDGQVMIAHDALLTRWQRLRTWVEQEEATLLVGRRIHMATQLWDEGGRSPEALLPGEAEVWDAWAKSDSAPMLSANEREFIAESLAHGRTGQERLRTEARATSQRQRLTVTVTIGAVLLAIIAAVASIHATNSAREAERTTREAQAQRVALLSRQLRTEEPNVAAQLAVAAHALDEDPQTRSSVLEAAGANLPYRVLGPAGATQLATTPESPAIVRGDSVGRLSVWREGDLTAAPEVVETGGGPVADVALTSHSSRLLAIVAGQATASIWDLTATPRKLGDWAPTGLSAHSAVWQEDIAFIGLRDGQILRIDTQIPDYPEELEPLRLGQDATASALAATPGLVVAGGQSDRLATFGPTSDAPTEVSLPSQVRCLGASPDGSTIMAGLADGQVLLFTVSPEGLSHTITLSTDKSIHAVAHLGDRLLIGHSDGEVTLWSASGQRLDRYPARGVVTSLASSPAGVITGTTEGTLALWRPPTPLYQAQGAEILNVVQARDLVLIATSGGPRALATAGAGVTEVNVARAPDGTGYGSLFSASSSGDVIAAQSQAGQVVVLRRGSSGYEIDQVLTSEPATELVLSPGGNLLGIRGQDHEGYTLYQHRESGWELTGNIPSLAAGLAFNEAGTLAATPASDGTGLLLTPIAADGPGPSTVAQLPGRVAPNTFAFAPSGVLAAGDLNGEVTLLDVTDPAAPTSLAQLPEAHTPLAKLRYDGDGTNLVAVTNDGELWAWERREAGLELSLRLAPEGMTINDAQLGGGRLLLALGNGTAAAWPSDVSTAAESLCARAGDRLSVEEWQRLVPGVPFTSGCR